MTNTKPEPRADKALSFSRHHEMHVRDGSKTATVRYDDEKDIQEGDILKCKAEGQPFARVKVTNVEIAEVRKAPELIRRMGEKHGADGWKELKYMLNHYYDDSIHATTDVKVIVFEVSR